MADETTDAASEPVTEIRPPARDRRTCLPSCPDVVPVSISEGHAVAAGSYDASAIQVLEGLEAVRKRPGMYIGSTGERGLHHLVWEVVDNSVDEALAGYCDRIVLTLQADGGVRVEDNGRGIPTDIHPTEGIPAVTMALTLLHAGGKFGGGGYKVSGGLHGVGISVVNALSSRVIVEVKNRDHLWRQTFSVGVPDGELEQVREMEDGESTGTTIIFYASDDIFETTHYNLETVTNRIREYAFLNKGLEIVVRDERPAGVDRRHRRRHAGGRRRDSSAAAEETPRVGRCLRAALQVRPRPGRLRRLPQPAQGQGQPDHHQLRGRDARVGPRTT